MVRELGPLIGAIDQGTSSTRFLVFAARTGELVTYHQKEIKKIYVLEEWVEQNPNDIYNSVLETIAKVAEKLAALDIDVTAIKAVGLCNQRETTVVWDKTTGEPVHNAIVWLDNRTKDIVDKILDGIPGRDINYFKHKTGLPISTYFSAFKLRWLFENEKMVREKHKEGKLLFGTVDAWLLWKLTKNHFTDVSNASRTFLMDIETLEWDEQLCKFFNIPMNILPKIKPSGDSFGCIAEGPLTGVPITGVIGDQSSALIGQNCLCLGQTKATFGTGCFIMQNIGSGSVQSALKGVPLEARHSLVTTVAFKFGNKPAVYALEGSVAIAGAAITWLRDNLELIKSYDEVEPLAKQVPDAGGVYFVPAFQGLYAPYWDPNASGTIIGMSQFTKKAHIMRAVLESIAYQTSDVLSLMRRSDTGINVDGGMSANDLVCQVLADINGVPVIRPQMIETTALGAAMVAGNTLGLWAIEPKCDDLNEDDVENGRVRRQSFLRKIARSLSTASEHHSKGADIFQPSVAEEKREEMTNAWKLAVERSMRWTKIKKQEQQRREYRIRSTLPIGFFMLSSFAILILSGFPNQM